MGHSKFSDKFFYTPNLLYYPETKTVSFGKYAGIEGKFTFAELKDAFKEAYKDALKLKAQYKLEPHPKGKGTKKKYYKLAEEVIKPQLIDLIRALKK